MDRTETMDRERMPEPKKLPQGERNLRIALLAIVALTALASPALIWKMDFIPVWKSVWIAFLGANLIVWFGVLVAAGWRAVSAAMPAKQPAREEEGDAVPSGAMPQPA